MIHRVLSLAVLLLAGCDFVPFSSGELVGTLTPAPDDWTVTASAEVIEIETNPSDPYSVKLWIVGLGPSLYVHAGTNRAAWVEHIEADPSVRLLIGNSLYELHALRVDDPGEFRTFADAYEIKYGRRPGNENVSEAYLFRLNQRNQ
jgi:hypothetical protein